MTKFRRTLQYVAIAAILAVIAVPLTTVYGFQGIGQTPEGAWNVTVVFDQAGLPPCAPAGTIVTTTSPGRGTVLAESCYASEGLGYGSWVRTGRNQFAITFIGNSFGSGGTVESTYKVRAQGTLNHSGDSFTGPFQTEFFDLNHNSLGSVTGTISAVRIE